MHVLDAERIVDSCLGKSLVLETENFGWQSQLRSIALTHLRLTSFPVPLVAHPRVFVADAPKGS